MTMTGAFPVQPARGPAVQADPAGLRVPVAGRVLERVTDETWLVDVGGNRVTIQTPEALEPGARVLVLLATRDTDAAIVRPRVQPDSGQTVAGEQVATPGEATDVPQAAAAMPILLGALANADRSAPPASRAQLLDTVLQLVRDGQLPEPLAQRLLGRLAPLRSSDDSRTIAESIQQHVERDGLLLEGQIARALAHGAIDGERLAGDLRAVLGQIVVSLAAMKDGAPTMAVPLAQLAATAARDLAQDVLVTQLETAADVARHGTWRFDLSLMSSGHAVPVAIEWEPDRDSRSGGRGPAARGRVSVFIDVAVSGIEARVAWSPSVLQVDLFAESDAVRDRLVAAMETLTHRLSAIGFTRVVANAWTNPARLARWRLGTAVDPQNPPRVFEAEA